MKESVAADIRSIFSAEDLATTQTKLAAAIEKYSRSAPQLATWMENSLPEAFTVFAFPEPVRKCLRTSNLCEASQQTDPPPHPRSRHLPQPRKLPASGLSHPHGNLRGLGNLQSLPQPTTTQIILNHYNQPHHPNQLLQKNCCLTLPSLTQRQTRRPRGGMGGGHRRVLGRPARPEGAAGGRGRSRRFRAGKRGLLAARVRSA